MAEGGKNAKIRTGGKGPAKRIRARVNRKRTCIFCERVFSDHRYLQDHISGHIGERPYPCPQCDRWFKNFSTLWDHRRVVHEGIKWTCEFCLQEFQALSNLCGHKRRQHPNELRAAKITKRKTKGQQPHQEVEVKRENANAVQKKNIGVKKKVTKTVVKLLDFSKKYNNSKPLTSTNTLPPNRCKCKLCGKILNKSSIKRHLEKRHSSTADDGKSNNASSTSEVDKTLTVHATVPTVVSEPKNTQQKVSSSAGSNSIQKPPFKPHNGSTVTPKKWDVSFFLHMNRYKVEDSCFYNPVVSNPVIISSELKTSKIVKKEVKIAKSKITSKSTGKGIKGNTQSFCAVLAVKVKSEEDKTDNNVQLHAVPKMQTDIKVETPDTISEDAEENYTDEANSSPEEFKCKKCGKILASKYTFQRHAEIRDCVRLKLMRDLKTDLSLAYICHFCKKDFGERRSNLIRHIASVHRYQGKEEDDKESGSGSKQSDRHHSEYSCGFCGVSSEIKDDLQQHILLNHYEMLGSTRGSV